MPKRLFPLIVFAALSTRADGLINASITPGQYTLGGWGGSAAAGALSLASARAGLQTLGRSLACGFIVTPSMPLGDSCAQVIPGTPSERIVNAVGAFAVISDDMSIDHCAHIIKLWTSLTPSSPSQAPVGSATRVQSSDLQGAAVWLLRDFLATYK